MSYQTLADVNFVSEIVGFILWTVMLLRLFINLFRKRYAIVKSSVQLLINSLVFLFAAAAVSSFAIVVGKRSEEWANSKALEWTLWAITCTLILTAFNIIYQKRIEKKWNIKETIIISVIDLTIMLYGVLLAREFGLTP